MKKWAVVFSDVIERGNLVWQLESLYKQNDHEDFFLFIIAATAAVAGEAERVADDYRSRYANIAVCEKGVSLSRMRELCGSPCFIMAQSERFFWVQPQYLQFLEEALSRGNSPIGAFPSVGGGLPASGFFAGRVAPEFFAGLDRLVLVSDARALFLSSGSGMAFPFAQELTEVIESLFEQSSGCRFHAYSYERALVAFSLSTPACEPSAMLTKAEENRVCVERVSMTHGEFFYQLLSDDTKRQLAAYLSIAENRRIAPTSLVFTKEALEVSGIRKQLFTTLARLKAASIRPDVIIAELSYDG